MKNKILFAVILMLAVTISTSKVYAQVSVVVSASSSNTASEADIKAMFAGTQLNWASGDKVAVLDQPATPTAETFYSSFVGKSVKKVRKTWTKLVLSGQASAPVKCSSSADVKAQLAKNPNAVGYINSSDVDGSVKVIAKIG